MKTAEELMVVFEEHFDDSHHEGEGHHHHEHEHDHHEHSHHHDGEKTSPEEALALLNYMVGHNKHHAEELHELAHSVSGEAAELLHSALKDYEEGNVKLEKALGLLKGDNK
ncbi:MAG: cobalt transporter [Lachnospiraceae bacterium]|nr:cobalt transporter [Lachnospiraceae bacterium]